MSINSTKNGQVKSYSEWKKQTKGSFKPFNRTTPKKELQHTRLRKHSSSVSCNSIENRQVESYNYEKFWSEWKKQKQVKGSFKPFWDNWLKQKKAGSLDLRSVCSEWLNGYKWDWFTSLTFRNRITAKAANKKWNKWLKALENELNDRVGYFRCTELQKGRKVLHFHSLMLNLSGLHTRTMGNWLKAEKLLKKIKEDPEEEEIEELAIRIFWEDQWNEIAGFGRIYPYDPKKGGNYYLSKYISKELSDYKLGGCILKI